MSSSIQIDIVSDVVCPWCIIGYKRLEAAMKNLPQMKFSISWHPFELNPNMQEGGENLREHLSRKYGITPSGSIEARKRLTEFGGELGFSFLYTDDMKIYNTLKAHQLLHYAREHAKEHELKLKFFEDYFSLNKNMEDNDVLIESATAVGLDENQCKKVLQTNQYSSEVKAEIESYQAMGIHAVPAFIFNGKYLVSGAQGPSTFQSVIENLQPSP